MAEIVNLRVERKRAKRREAGQKAATNRLIYGQSRAEREFDKAQSEKARKGLEGHRRETGDGQ